MSVARCCCPKPQPEPVPVPFPANFQTTWEIGGTLINIDYLGQSAFFGRYTALGLPDTRRVSGYVLFPNVTIPQGSNITLARLVCDQIAITGLSNAFPLINAVPGPVSTPGIASADIALEAADDASVDPTPPLDPAFLDSLTRTNAKVKFQINEGQTSGPNSFTYDGLEAMFQEVIDRPGWSSGNSIALLADEDGNSTFDETDPLGYWGINSAVSAFEDSPAPEARYPRLEIAWT